MTFGPMAASTGAARRTRNYLQVQDHFSWNGPIVYGVGPVFYKHPNNMLLTATQRENMLTVDLRLNSAYGGFTFKIQYVDVASYLFFFT